MIEIRLDGCPGTTCRACMSLTVGLSKQKSQMAHLLMMENTHANLYWNPSKIVGVTVRTKMWPSSVTVTLGLGERMFQMAHLHLMENNCVKLFWNPSTIVELLVRTKLDGSMHNCTHIHWIVIVTTMTCSPQGGLTKKVELLPLYKGQTFTIWEKCLDFFHLETICKW